MPELPGKTHSEKIDDLLRFAASQTERVDNLARRIGELEEKVSGATEKMNGLETRLTLQEEQTKEARAVTMESSRSG